MSMRTHALTDKEQTDSSDSGSVAPGRHHNMWFVIAALLTVTCVGGSFFTANVIANTADQKSRNAFEASSAEIATTLQLAIQREQDLVFSGAAYLAANPNTSNTQFLQWVNTEQAAQRYPELQDIALAIFVTDEDLPAFTARINADPPISLAPGETFQVVPPGKRPNYCFISTAWHRNAPLPIPIGTDYCAGTDVLKTRETGAATYVPYKVGGNTVLVVQMPVYKGGIVPATVQERRDTYLGGFGITLAPSIVLTTALTAHPESAVKVSYHSSLGDGISETDATFTSGDIPSHGPRTTVDLRNGWMVQVFGSPTRGGILGNAGALGVALAGLAFSLTLCTLIIVLATSRRRALTLVQRQTAEIREQAEQIEHSERKFRSLIQNSSDLTLVCDTKGTLTYVSATSERVIGIADADLLDTHIATLLRPNDWNTFEEWLDTSGDNALLLTCNIGNGSGSGNGNGSGRWAEVIATDLRDDPAVQGVVLNMRDITDRHRLEVELRHAQKLESVGQLSAGIAHEINTPIQFIGDNIHFLQDAFAALVKTLEDYRKIADAAEANNALKEARRVDTEVQESFLTDEVPLAISDTLAGVERVATIVRAMKEFGHPGNDSAAPADLNDAVRTTLVVANNQIKDVATVVTELSELPPIVCHIGDINQVLLNLVINAAHAIGEVPRDDGLLGTITVRSRVDLNDAVLEVSDTGCGIPPDIANRIFDPFFTTKGVGSGTGQGLAVVHSLIHDRHKGTVSFRSEPGVGTTFVVRLPLVQGEQ